MIENFDSIKDARKVLKPKQLREIHQRALNAANDFKTSEINLIDALQTLAKTKVYRNLGYNSLHVYGVEALGLSESQSYDYGSVALKSLKIPKLKEAIRAKELTVTKARRLCSVIDDKNQLKWLELGKRLSKKDLEREIAKTNPRESVPEQARFIASSLLELKLPISERAYEKLERARDLLQQKRQSKLNLDEVIEEIAADVFIQRTDPLEKAKRAEKRKIKQKVNVKKEFGPGQKMNSSLNIRSI
jgi:hypothetical protein